MRKLRVVFGSPPAGWLPLVLGSDDREFKATVSFTPNDFVEELIAAAASVESIQGAFRAVGFEEPCRLVVELTRNGADVLLSVRRPSEQEAAFTFSGSCASVVLPIWRALRCLQSDPQLSAWGRPFPTERMAALSMAVERLKSSQVGSDWMVEHQPQRKPCT